LVHRVRGIYLDSSRSPRASAGREQCRQRQNSGRAACCERKGGNAYTGCNQRQGSDSGAYGGDDCCSERDSGNERDSRNERHCYCEHGCERGACERCTGRAHGRLDVCRALA